MTPGAGIEVLAAVRWTCAGIGAAAMIYLAVCLAQGPTCSGGVQRGARTIWTCLGT